jgi:hypothetical protein
MRPLRLSYPVISAVRPDYAWIVIILEHIVVDRWCFEWTKRSRPEMITTIKCPVEGCKLTLDGGLTRLATKLMLETQERQTSPN